MENEDLYKEVMMSGYKRGDFYTLDVMYSTVMQHVTILVDRT